MQNGEQPVSESKARMLSEDLCTDYLECSALTQHNLKEVFDAAILTALRSIFTNGNNNNNNNNNNGNGNGNDRDEKKSSRIRQGFKRIVTLTKGFYKNYQ
ncbi:BMA-CHW-1 [Dirofilaria immitis]|nr:BMA-CHW-1 [Dirofilaria immitis]